ncbi:hypothetical protein [Natrialba sp. SSL1]|uniref:hypothetical protein n=1 Tax=Natrialba sp. SSL1 TaxID=1869245 RepID=UPI0008F81AE8|nr:hypothetical protein [Natrialba sp. SSL1]OIB56506.1 hypothetical protein BBD46_17945 [Natrialba sp. SSL1]
MTDSTTDDNAGDGGVDVGGHGTDLFGEMTDDVFGGPAVDEDETRRHASETDDDGTATAEETDGADETSTDTTGTSDGVADQTAASVFGQLKGDDEAAVDDVLDEDSPDDIIASADEEPDEHPGDDLEGLLADEGELEELLLTGRTKEQEFLWVDTGESVEADETVTESEGESESGAGTGADSETGTPGAGPDPDASATDESVDAHADAADTPADSPRVVDDGPITDRAVDETNDERTVDDSAAIEGETGTDTERDRDSEPEPDAEVDTETDTETDTNTNTDGVLTRLRTTVGNLF